MIQLKMWGDGGGVCVADGMVVGGGECVAT